MSNRNEFTFQFTGKQLAEAAHDRQDHHEARLTWWTGQQDDAEKAMKNATVTIIEQEVTGGVRRIPQIDPQYASRYNECMRKIEQHKAQSEDYERWARAFNLNPDRSYELDADDVHFFDL